MLNIDPFTNMNAFLRYTSALLHPFLLVILFSVNASSQSDLDLRYWKYEPISIASSKGSNSFKGNQILGSAIDPYGLIWLTTLLGITTYDGDRYELHPDFQTEDLKYYTINSRYLKFDPLGRLWVLTDDRGAIMYDFKTKKYKLLNANINADYRLSDNSVSDIIFEGDSCAWLSTSDLKLHKLDFLRDSVAIYSAWQTVKAQFPNVAYTRFGQMVLQDSFIWVANRYGIVQFNKNTSIFNLIKYEVEPELYDPLVSNFAMYLNKSELIVAPSFKNYNGLSVLDTRNLTWKLRIELPLTKTILQDVIRSINPLAENKVIAGARRHGFVILDLDDYSYEKIEEADVGLSFRDLSEVYNFYRVSKNIGYFVCHHNIIKATSIQNPFHSFYLTRKLYNDNKGNWQVSFLEDDRIEGGLIGTAYGDGVLQVDIKKNTVLNIPYKSSQGQKNSDISINSMVRGEDQLIWLGTSEGIMQLDLDKKRIKPDHVFALSFPEIKNVNIHELFFLKPYLFISTFDKGLYKYHPEQKTLKQIRFGYDVTYASGHRVNDIISLNESTYCLSTTFGLRYLSDTASTLSIPTNLKKDKLASIELKYMYRTGDSIWIASNGQGLYQLTLDQDKVRGIENFRNEENILYNKLSKIVPDPDGQHFWLNTGDGFSKFNTHTHHFTNYSLEEGIGFVGRNGKFFYKLKNDIIVAGALAKFHYFHPDSLKPFFKVKPYLRSFFVADQMQPIRSFEKDTFWLSKGEKNLTFDISAINHNSNPLCYYSYKLEGYDKNWSSPGRSSIARFTKIPGGAYQFKYKVANKNFDWTEGAPVSLTIDKKLTEYSGFWMSVFFILIGLVYLTYRRRLAAIRRQTKLEHNYIKKINELEMSALRLQMNPHFVFNSINSINWFIIKNEKDNASNYLTKFSRLIRLSLENSKSRLIPIKNELEAIEIYLEMEKLRFDQKFEFDIRIESHINVASLFIPPMIIQPFVENAIWHGIMHKKEKGRIQILLRKQEKGIQCIVEDNGVGREASQKINARKKIKKQSLGMKITQERLQFVGRMHGVETQAQTTIVDLYDESGLAKGTRIIIDFPQINSTKIHTS